MPALENAKHEHFAQLVAKGLSASKAYVSAGYSEAGAAQSGARLLRNAEIHARVAELREQVSERAVEKAALDQAWVLTKLRENVERAMKAQPVLDREGNETGEYRYEGMVANKALELLGRQLGMFSKKVEHTGEGGGPITIEARVLQGLSDEELRLIHDLAKRISDDNGQRMPGAQMEPGDDGAGNRGI